LEPVEQDKRRKHWHWPVASNRRFQNLCYKSQNFGHQHPDSASPPGLSLGPRSAARLLDL